MRKITILLIAGFLATAAGDCLATQVGGGPYYDTPTVGRGADISLAYLQQAREYRDQGRYELARQSYSQALSTCNSVTELEVIKRELAAVELLIRTMR